MKRSTLRRGLYALLGWCFATTAVRAQTNVPNAQKNDSIQLQLASPFALTQQPLMLQARAGRWLPIAATLSNNGEAVSGTLTLRLRDATESERVPTEYFSNIELPSNSHKRIWLYGRMDSGSIDKFDVSFAGRGFETIKREGTVQAADPSTRIVVTISDNDEKLAYLSGLRGVGLGLPVDALNTPNGTKHSAWAAPPQINSATAPVRPLGAPHDLMPSRWIGWDAADLVVLQDFPHTALTPSQIAALRSYAAGGGAVLALGGANWQRLTTSPLADLWPLQLQSSGAASAVDVSTLVNSFARFPDMNGADRLGGAPVVVSHGQLRAGARTLLGTGRSPLLAMNRYGAGQVLLLAIDPTQPPFLGWRGLPRLWAEVFHATHRPPQISPQGYDNDETPMRYSSDSTADSQNLSNELFQALVTSPQLRTPPVSFIAWFLALYIFFLVPVNYVVLRFFDKRELAWITIPMIVIVFSLMSYITALRIKGTAILTRQINLVQGSTNFNATPTHWARSDAMLWLYSPRKTSYDLSSNDAQMAITDYANNAQTSLAIREPEESKAFALDKAAINMWDYRSFVGNGIADLKGGLRLFMQGGKVGLRNDTDQTLKGVVLVSQGRLWAYKTLKPGQSGLPDPQYQQPAKQITASLVARVLRASRFDPQLLPMFSSETKKHEGQQFSSTGFASIPNRLLELGLGAEWDTPTTFVVAWCQSPLAGLTIGNTDAKAQNLSLLLLRVDDDSALRYLSATTKSLAPSKARLLSSESLTTNNKGTGVLYTYEAKLPRVPAERITITLQTTFSTPYGSAPNQKTAKQDMSVQSEIYNAVRGTWQPLTLHKSTSPSKKPKDSSSLDNNQSQRRFTANVSGELLQQCLLQPDTRIQLRIKTASEDLKINQALVSIP